MTSSPKWTDRALDFSASGLATLVDRLRNGEAVGLFARVSHPLAVTDDVSAPAVAVPALFAGNLYAIAE